jgi:hypothetical protein
LAGAAERFRVPAGSHQEFRAEVALSRVEEVITGTRAAEAHDEYQAETGQL